MAVHANRRERIGATWCQQVRTVAATPDTTVTEADRPGLRVAVAVPHRLTADVHTGGHRLDAGGRQPDMPRVRRFEPRDTGSDLAMRGDASPRPAAHTHTAGPAVLDAADPATGTPAAPAVR